jgi:undecaprenyl diphosphate synthase
MKNDLQILPAHIGFIIDGNGRWAKKRGLPRSMGHKAGVKTLDLIIKECFYTYNIKHVSIYAFSSENWNRPQQEVDYLMNIFRKYLSSDFAKNYPRAKLVVMGELDRLPPDLAQKAQSLMEQTKDNTDFVINLGINYSGQDELVRAVSQIVKEQPAQISRKTIDDHLYTHGQPPLDFVVRTSGEMRISNFMLWQISYAELYFPTTFWPDFKKRELHSALVEYSRRNRRFGAIKEEKTK